MVLYIPHSSTRSDRSGVGDSPAAKFTRCRWEQAPPQLTTELTTWAKLTSRVGQGVEIVLAGAARLDQAAVTQECEMVADRGLALRSQIRAELGDIALFLAQKYQHLQAGRIGDLLEQLSDATDLGRRSGRRRACGLCERELPKAISVVGGILFLKRKSCLCFCQADARCEASSR